jgi:hypothetical protein
MNTVAERVFGQKLLHSEPDRQAYIQQTALRIERDLKAAVRKDKAELHEIAGCVQSFMDAETMGFVLLAMDDGDIGAIRSAQLMLQNELLAAIQRTAECRAIKHVEAMTPEEFKQD